MWNSEEFKSLTAYYWFFCMTFFLFCCLSWVCFGLFTSHWHCCCIWVRSTSQLLWSHVIVSNSGSKYLLPFGIIFFFSSTNSSMYVFFSYELSVFRTTVHFMLLQFKNISMSVEYALKATALVFVSHYIALNWNPYRSEPKETWTRLNCKHWKHTNKTMGSLNHEMCAPRMKTWTFCQQF